MKPNPLHALPSPLMADDDQRERTPKTQQTPPKKGKPIEIRCQSAARGRGS